MFIHSFVEGASHVVKLFVPVSICMLIVILTIKTTSLLPETRSGRGFSGACFQVPTHRVAQLGRKKNDPEISRFDGQSVLF